MNAVVIWYVDNPKGIAPVVLLADPPDGRAARSVVTEMARNIAESYLQILPQPINGGSLEVRPRVGGFDLIRDGEVRELAVEIHTDVLVVK